MGGVQQEDVQPRDVQPEELQPAAPLPAALAAHLAEVLPADRLAAAQQARRLAVRVNGLRADAARAHVVAALATVGVRARPVEWMPDALAVERGAVREIQACPLHAAGAIHIQSLASMAVGHALAPRPGSQVLDMCAAPGSKTSHLAALLGNRGRLVAADASRARLFRLREVLRHLGAEAQVLMERAERWGRRAPCGFDSVLVDAPCSAEGRALAGDADAAADWSLRKCRRLASQQKAALHSAIEACVPGGVVVYSTCTLGPQENEAVLARALELYEGRVALEALPVRIPGALPGMLEWRGQAFPPQMALAQRVAPLSAAVHPDGPWLEGFFIARLRKVVPGTGVPTF